MGSMALRLSGFVRGLAFYLLLPTGNDDLLVIQQDSLSQQMYKNISTVFRLLFQSPSNGLAI